MEKVENLSMCRICLVVNVRMCVVTNKSLLEMYERLADVPFVTKDRKPLLACFFCCSRLKQCCQLQRKCVEAEELLAQMLSEDCEQNPLTDRGHLEFVGGFIITPIENINIVNDCQIGSNAIKHELPDVCEEQDDVELQLAHLREKLEPESLHNSHPNVEAYHSEFESEEDQLVMEIKIEEEELSENLRVRETEIENDRYSPLPPGADAILSPEKMQGVWRDVFPNDHQEESVTVTYLGDKSPAATAVQVQEVITEDAYIPTDPMTPGNISDCLQSLQSQHNQDSPMPVTPIFSNLLDQSTLFTVTQTQSNIEQPEQQSDVQDTPVPSPVNKHAKCDDSFCCQHNLDGYACPSVASVDTIGTDSNYPSPEPATLLKNKGKNRPRNYDNWGDIKRKKLKNQGKTYCSKKGRTIDAKSMGQPCQCRYKCATKIAENERIELFTKFWELGVREQQWLYVANYTTKQQKARTFQRELKHQREYTYKYFLPKKSPNNVSYDKITVCKTMFLNTLGITERLTRTAWTKYDGSTAVEQDMRGRHKNHRKLINDEMLLSVCAHVNSFVPIESHYCRKSSKKHYLDGSLSIARMFNMYKEWPDLDKYSNKATNLRQYREIVNSQFNLTFHISEKDTCDQCHIFKPHLKN